MSRHVPRSQKDAESWISRIRDIEGYWILYFYLSWDRGDFVSRHDNIPWDPRNLGSRTENSLLDPGDPESTLSRLSLDLADLGSYTTIMSLYFEHPLHPMKFCFWFPISMRCLNLSTVKNFNHTLIQPFCVGLKTSSPCWFLNMFSIIDVLLTGCGWREINAHFITS